MGIVRACASVRAFITDGAWPLQDMLSPRSFCARINSLSIAHPYLRCPHFCNTIARLLRGIQNPPTRLVCAMDHIQYCS